MRTNLSNLREGVAPRPGTPGGRVTQKGDQDTQGNGRSRHSAAREEREPKRDHCVQNRLVKKGLSKRGLKELREGQHSKNRTEEGVDGEGAKRRQSQVIGIANLGGVCYPS